MKIYLPMKWKTFLNPNLTRIDWISCILSGICLSLAFPPLEWSYLIWIALIPVLLCIKPGYCRGNGFLGFFTGLVYYSLHLYWIYKVTIAGLIILILFLSLLLAMIFLGVGWLIQKRFGVIASAFLWAFVELIRAIPPFTFAWGYLGHSLYQWEQLLQVTPWIGVSGLSFLIFGFNLALAYYLSGLWKNRDRWKAYLFSSESYKEMIPFAGFILLLVMAALYGEQVIKESSAKASEGSSFRVALVQGNVPNDPGISAEEQVSSYMWFTEQILDQKPELVFWPECTVAVPINYCPELITKIQDFSDRNQVEIATGSLFDEKTGKGKYISYNSVVLFAPGTKWNLTESPIQFPPNRRYDKMQLVPFGEYVPFGKTWPLNLVSPLIEKLIENAGVGLKEPGRGLELFQSVKGIRYGFSICFESTLAAQNARLKKMGADFLAVITYDTWFDGTVGLKQHFVQSAFRAAENRCYVVRASNSGLTAVFGPTGKVMKEIYPYQPGVCVCDLFISTIRVPVKE